MKIGHSSKKFKLKPSKSTPISLNDNLLFSPSELKHMHYDKKRSKIIKITITCLLVAIIGTIAYVGSVRYEQYNKTNCQPLHIMNTQSRETALINVKYIGA